MYINKAILLGNLTRDPEKKALPSGDAVTSFSIATNRVWKDKNGATQESSDFHNIVVFGRQADNCAQYLKKGQSVAVEGRIQTRSWDGPDGQKKYRTEIVADRVQFGPKTGAGGGTGAGATGGGFTSGSSKAGANQPPKEDDGAPIEYPQEEINPDDIPF